MLEKIEILVFVLIPLQNDIFINELNIIERFFVKKKNKTLFHFLFS